MKCWSKLGLVGWGLVGGESEMNDVECWFENKLEIWTLSNISVFSYFFLSYSHVMDLSLFSASGGATVSFRFALSFFHLIFLCGPLTYLFTVSVLASYFVSSPTSRSLLRAWRALCYAFWMCLKDSWGIMRGHY